jgi:hypothetical protein
MKPTWRFARRIGNITTWSMEAVGRTFLSTTARRSGFRRRPEESWKAGIGMQERWQMGISGIVSVND